MKQADVVFRIGQIIRAVEARSGLDQLDRASREVLWFIGEADAAGEAPNMRSIINGARVGTAPTVYARLADLEGQGWITSADDERDGRVKRLRLTAKARRAFAQMSAEIQKQRQSFAS